MTEARTFQANVDGDEYVVADPTEFPDFDDFDSTMIVDGGEPVA